MNKLLLEIQRRGVYKILNTPLESARFYLFLVTSNKFPSDSNSQVYVAYGTSQN